MVRATGRGLWLETITKGKRSEMLVREGDPYTVLTSPPKATHDDADDAPPTSKTRTEMVGTTVETNSHSYSVTKVDSKKIFLTAEDGRELSVTVDDDEDAPKQLRVGLFAKTLDWKRQAIPALKLPPVVPGARRGAGRKVGW